MYKYASKNNLWDTYYQNWMVDWMLFALCLLFSASLLQPQTLVMLWRFNLTTYNKYNVLCVFVCKN